MNRKAPIHRSTEFPVVEIIGKRKVPASQMVAFYVHLVAPRRVASSAHRDEGFYETFPSVGHVYHDGAGPVRILAHLVSGELGSHEQT